MVEAPGPIRRSVPSLRWVAGLALLAMGGAVGLTMAAGTATAPDRGVPVPKGFPVPAVPTDNLFSPAKAELGRYLFYDRRLSANGTFACASCHQQALAFTDGQPTAVGATGERHRRNAMSLANVVYNRTFNWADGKTASLEEQALVPMFGLAPIEMGMSGAEEAILRALATDADYPRLFGLAFPTAPEPISMANVVRAITTFERTLLSFDAPYDRYLRHGQRSALEPAAGRGLELFFSARLGCSQCHAGFNLAGNTTWFGRPETALEFHNTGLYNLGRGRYPASDTGRFEATGLRRDMGRFRAPTLRNIALTAPYMHDGSLATLEEVLDHYAAGGRARHASPGGEVGRRNRYQSRLIKPQKLTAAERRDLLAFLDSLTDHDFVTDPRLADPRSGPARPATLPFD